MTPSIRPTLQGLRAGDDPDRWRSVGFTVSASGVCTIGTVALSVAPDAGGAGIRSWSLHGLDAATVAGGIDGLACTGDTDADGREPAPHPNGTVAIDHVVVATPDVGRTVAALEAVGLELRRTRNGESAGRRMRQAFFRLGERPGPPVLEVVGPPEPAGDGLASFFGLALTVDDLDATAAWLGPDLGRVKEAVQPGRRIATLRSAAGVGTAVAFMSA